MTSKPLKKMLIKRIYIIAALLLIIGGGTYVLLPHAQALLQRKSGEHVNPAILATRAHAATTTKPISNIENPIRFTIERLGINLPITQGEYYFSTKEWLLDNQHVFFATPGQRPIPTYGAPLFYGHATSEIFKPLRGIAANELLEIQLANNKILLFRYTHSAIAAPDYGSILQEPHKTGTVTVLTCTGSMFENRQIFYFTYVGTVQANSAKSVKK